MSKCIKYIFAKICIFKIYFTYMFLIKVRHIRQNIFDIHLKYISMMTKYILVAKSWCICPIYISFPRGFWRYRGNRFWITWLCKKRISSSTYPTYIRLRLFHLILYVSINNARIFTKFSDNIFLIFYFPKTQQKKRFFEISEWPWPLKIIWNTADGNKNCNKLFLYLHWHLELKKILRWNRVL